MARTPLFAFLRRALQEAARAHRPPRSDGPSRRQVLGGALGAAALVPVLSACGDNVDGTGSVAVIGAGTAGLHCAVRLAERGVDVTVYEASGRTGGRMFTDRGPYPDGKVIELGGELVDSNHVVMMGLCSELGLTLDELPLDTEGLREDTFHFDGAVVSAATIVSEFTPLAARMQMAAMAGDDPAEFERLDNQSITAWLGDPAGGNLPPTSLIRRLLERAYVGEYGLEVDRQSVWNLLYLIDFDTPDPFRIYGDSDERYHIHTGSQAVPDGLAARLTGRIELEHRLVAIAAKSDGRPVLTFDTPGGTVTVEPDRAVLSLPFTTLRQVDLADAGFSDEKRAMIQSLGYGTNSKLMLRFSSRPWRTASNANGSSVSDVGQLQATWETSRGYPGADGILTNFTGGDRGVASGQGTAAERAAEVLPWIDTIFPGTQAAFIAGSAVRQHWPTAPFALGSYACYEVGQAGFSGLEGEAEGAFHFCGEHTSVEAQGYMEGAAETGLRAAMEVLDAFGISPSPQARFLADAAARRPARARRYRHRRGGRGT